jgi:IclR family KDG regulon transcriptional repressor
MPAPDLRTVERALSVLDLIASDPDSEWGLSTLGKRVGLSKATTLRMLGTLQKHGYVTRDGLESRYRLGPRVLSLAGALRPRLRSVAHPKLHELVERTGETALLYLLDGIERVCADEVASPHPVRVSYAVGTKAPLHAGASGKVLLAFMASTERRRLLELLPLDRFTSATTTTVAELEREFAAIREQGYAHSTGEHDASVFGISAPVFSGDGRLEAAATIAGPLSRWQAARGDMYIEAVVDAARQISYGLGYGHRTLVPAMAGGG